VDFASFPLKVITLLDKCTSPSATDVTRFQAVLTVRGAESIFRIVEINDFKQLPHITLTFRPGNDSSVKQFLAFRLQEVRGNCTDLTNELQSTKSDRESLQTQLSSCQQQLAQVKEEYSRHTLEAQADFKTQRALTQEEGLRERETLKEHHEKEKQDLERRFREQNDALSSRASELDAENRKLRDQKYDLDSKVSELSHKLGSAEGSKRSLEEEASRLKQQNQQLSSEKHEREIQLNEARAKLIALDDKVQAQVEIIEQQRSRVRELEAAARQAEGRCEDLKEASTGHELRAREAQQELLKANQVIEKIMVRSRCLHCSIFRD
jgi:spindle assembly abnormal protein 6